MLRTLYSLSRLFEKCAVFGIALMALVTLADVITSKFFKLPVPGSTEMVGVLQIFAIAGAFAFSKIDGRHIRIEILLELLPQGARRGLEFLSSLLGLGFFLVATFSTLDYGLGLLKSGTKTLLLHIPLSPFLFWVFLCFILVCFVFVFELSFFSRKSGNPWTL